MQDLLTLQLYIQCQIPRIPLQIHRTSKITARLLLVSKSRTLANNPPAPVLLYLSPTSPLKSHTLHRDAARAKFVLPWMNSWLTPNIEMNAISMDLRLSGDLKPHNLPPHTGLQVNHRSPVLLVMSPYHPPHMKHLLLGSALFGMATLLAIFWSRQSRSSSIGQPPSLVLSLNSQEVATTPASCQPSSTCSTANIQTGKFRLRHMAYKLSRISCRILHSLVPQGHEQRPYYLPAKSSISTIGNLFARFLRTRAIFSYLQSTFFFVHNFLLVLF